MKRINKIFVIAKFASLLQKNIMLVTVIPFIIKKKAYKNLKKFLLKAITVKARAIYKRVVYVS